MAIKIKKVVVIITLKDLSTADTREKRFFYSFLVFTVMYKRLSQLFNKSC